MTRPSHFRVNNTELPSRLKISVSMNVSVLEFYGYISGYFFMMFFNRNWAGAWRNCWAGPLTLDVGLLYKNKKQK